MQPKDKRMTNAIDTRSRTDSNQCNHCNSM